MIGTLFFLPKCLVLQSLSLGMRIILKLDFSHNISPKSVFGISFDILEITVNGEIHETEFVSATELRAYECVPELGDFVGVCFAGDNLVVLSETETVPY